MSKNKTGKLIEIAMSEKDLTQKMLAEKLNVKQSMISQWITGKSNPKISTLQKIAKALDMPIDYFVEEEENIAEINSKIKIDINKMSKKDIELLLNEKDIKILKLEKEILSLKLENEMLRNNKGKK